MAAELSPHRPGINYIFILKKGKNGYEKNLLSFLLYGIIRDELLVLRKTLNELLDKAFICANNSLVRAPVLFAKKKRDF